MTLESNENNNNLPQDPAQAPSTRVRVRREAISQKEIDAIIESYNAGRRSAAEAVRHLVNTGRLLNEAQAKLRQSKSLDRRWESWVDRNLPFKIRAAQRCQKAARDVEENPLLLELPPEEFIARVWGNKPKQLPNGKGDKKGRGVVNDASDEADESEEDDSGDSKGSRKRYDIKDLDLTRPAHISEEEWSRMVVHRELIKQLEAYLNQPVAENTKLIMLVELYESVYARLEIQAEKLKVSVEEALKLDRKDL